MTELNFEQLPLRLNIHFRRGDTLRVPLHFQRQVVVDEVETWEDVDLTGHQFLAQARRKPDSPEIWATFSVEAISLATGEITIVLPAADTSGLSTKEGVWDIQATDLNDEVRTWVAGTFEAEPDVSRFPSV